MVNRQVGEFVCKGQMKAPSRYLKEQIYIFYEKPDNKKKLCEILKIRNQETHCNNYSLEGDSLCLKAFRFVTFESYHRN